METKITTSKKQVKGRNNNHTMGGKNNVGFPCFDFTIVGKTKCGQKLRTTIPAGTPRRQLTEFFEMIGYPAFFYNGYNNTRKIS